ncbi:PREDICTED: fumarate hydratase 1, mitochondrial-like [Populus euphratica]|uniref:Fumarate hydratase 1, mitochondrial-like n=1 Tax=Populus euphratica TaxID=75702 RepID=A0AAJ6TTB3_POPEU|nr:PREDICTED: fumarate hydratase 1, mitochondrial-like [Populus euphratica]
MKMYMVARRLSDGSTTSQFPASLRYGNWFRAYSTAFREERDTFGPILVPADKLWGAQTQRSLQNFDIGASAIECRNQSFEPLASARNAQLR